MAANDHQETVRVRCRRAARRAGRLFRRRRTWFVGCVLVWLMARVAMGSAVAAPPNGPTTPTGMGSLVPRPAMLTEGVAEADFSLYEATGGDTLRWQFDIATGDSWPPGAGSVEAAFNAVVQALWMFGVNSMHDALGLALWVFALNDITPLTGALSAAVGGGAGALLSWLLPSAIAIGAVVVYAQRREGEGLNGLVWVLIAALAGISMAQAAPMWVGATNNARAIGADAVTTMSSGAISPNSAVPFEWKGKATSYAAPDEKQAMMRKTADTTWRGVVATPWCLIEFGSIEACERYGADIISFGTDWDARKKYIDNEIKRGEGNDANAATVRWAQGWDWSQRLTVAIGMVLLSLAFSVLLLVLAFAVIAAVISTFLHLIVGPVFVMSLCIPGWPRRVGLRWLESLIGTIIQSFLALLVFSAALIAITAGLSTTADWGLGPALAVALAGAIGAIGFRGKLANILGMMTVGGGSSRLIGAMVMRTAMRGAGGIVRSITPGAPLPNVDRALGRGLGATGRGAGELMRHTGQRVGTAVTAWRGSPRPRTSSSPPSAPWPRSRGAIAAGASSAPVEGRIIMPGAGPTPRALNAPDTRPRPATGRTGRAGWVQGAGTGPARTGAARRQRPYPSARVTESAPVVSTRTQTMRPISPATYAPPPPGPRARAAARPPSPKTPPQPRPPGPGKTK